MSIFNSKLNFITGLLFFILFSFKASNVNAESILQLDPTNFDKNLKEHDLSLILVYENNCLVCEAYEKTLEEASKDTYIRTQYKTTLSVGKVNLSTHKQYIERLHIGNSPSLLLFLNKFGIYYEYQSPKKSINLEDVNTFVNSRLDHKWTELITVEGFQEIKKIDSHNIFICGDIKEKSNVLLAELFGLSPNIISSIKLHWSNTNVVKKEAGCEETDTKVLLLTKMGTSHEFNSDLTYENVRSWIDAMTIPISMDINPENIQYVYETRKLAFLFVYKDQDHFDAKQIAGLSATYDKFLELGKAYKVGFLFKKRENTCSFKGT